MELLTTEQKYKDLLGRLGVNGHGGAIAEITSLRKSCGLDNESNLVENRVSQPSEPTFGQWIDVEDGFPETGKDVLVFDESEGEPIYIAWRMSPRFEDDNTQIDEGSWQCEHYDKKLKITKWMPLPKP